jgi:hypothetical protein
LLGGLKTTMSPLSNRDALYVEGISVGVEMTGVGDEYMVGEEITDGVV